MPRVKCPHCGAGNQDATEQDTCWQCGNVLGAPVARAQPPPRAPIVETGAPTQQLDPSQLNYPAPKQQTTTPAGPSQRALAFAAVITVILAGLLILFIVMLVQRQ